MAVLGRVDAVVFGGGIGEHADEVRAKICSGLETLGLILDAQANRSANGREAMISRPDSPIKAYVVTLDEELYMAQAAARLVAR